MTVPVHGLPSLMREGLKVAVVPPQLKGSRWHTVEEATDDGRAGQLVSFADVTTIDGAQGLVGRYVLASREDLPDDFELRNVELLVGRQVTDEGLGLSGTIAEVMVGPANDVWVIDVAGEGELLRPVIDQVVGEVPEKGPSRSTRRDSTREVPAGEVRDALRLSGGLCSLPGRLHHGPGPEGRHP